MDLKKNHNSSIFNYFNILKSMISFLEIMLNEIRKKDISIGLFEYSELSRKEK